MLDRREPARVLPGALKAAEFPGRSSQHSWVEGRKAKDGSICSFRVAQQGAASSKWMAIFSAAFSARTAHPSHPKKSLFLLNLKNRANEARLTLWSTILGLLQDLVRLLLGARKIGLVEGTSWTALRLYS